MTTPTLKKQLQDYLELDGKRTQGDAEFYCAAANQSATFARQLLIALEALELQGCSDEVYAHRCRKALEKIQELKY